MEQAETTLINTGERLVTQVFEYWTLEHLHRYGFAKQFVKDKVVVDIASGEGYGSNLLAADAALVTGIDISNEAVNHAKKKYRKSNLTFLHGSADNIPLPDSSVDVLISFETIEHHDQHEKMMLEIKRVLKSDGLAIISSPDKKNYTDIPQYHNPFHVKELYTDEFRGLLENHFANVQLLFQKTVIGSVLISEKTSSNFIEHFGDYNRIDSLRYLVNPLYNIAVSSDGPVTVPNSMSIFTNEFMLQNFLQQKGELESLRIKVKNLENSRSLYLGRLLTRPFLMLSRLFK